MKSYKEKLQKARAAMEAIGAEYIQEIEEITDAWVGKSIIYPATGESRKILNVHVSMSELCGITVRTHDGVLITADYVDDFEVVDDGLIELKTGIRERQTADFKAYLSRGR